MEFAVLAGDGTVQLPLKVLGDFPPGTRSRSGGPRGAITLVADLPDSASGPASAPGPLSATGSRGG